MDIKVKKAKLGLKERYSLMTRGLGWNTTYHPMDEVFPYDKYEGIKVHDWDKWEDPFRLTMDAYWKYQAEKERKLYAIIDSFNQNNGHLNVTDARYINVLKLLLTGVSPLEYMAHRGFAHVGRQLRGVGAQIACQMQAIDEIRHVQTQIHSISNYNKYYNGMHDFRRMNDKLWYASVPKSFFDDAITAGPFEFMVAIGFSFEYVLTNLLFVPFISGAAYNGDVGAMTFGFSAQSDEARHMTLGLETIKFLLEQDPDNLPIVQRWIDKWTWRGTRVLTLVAMMMDYMLPKRVMSWKEAWNIYFTESAGALFRDLARYGITVPKCAEDATLAAEHVSHQAWAFLYQHNAVANFHTWIPSAEELDWLSAKYPNTFDKYYRPRWEHWRKEEAEGRRFRNKALPQLCQTCQVPMFFTEPNDPDKISLRRTEFKGEKYNFCSDHCKSIFDHEPEKYIQAWLPVHQIFQGNCFPAGTNPTEEGFDPLLAVLKYWSFDIGVDNADFEGSEDQKNFIKWRGLATANS